MASAGERPSPSTRSVSMVPTHRTSKKILTRNIDEVVLGHVAFPTWYYSPYPDDMILHADDRTSRQSSQSHASVPNGVSTEAYPKVCARLHVCPYCFRYTPVVEKYLLHLQHHRHREQADPSSPPVPDSASKVYEHDGYAVWEIDGEREKLYCQNLSLFGKLFLEQKSVFYDTAGFLYFVLTYTPPETTTPTTAPGKAKRGRRPASTHGEYGLKTQVLGFFSKENPSWDSNNLACILVFPPYQHRQLGKLLMAVSYKLSAWEWDVGIIGGPEKPLSEMGRRSYLRFWSERIARFMIGESADAERRRVFDKKKRKNSAVRKEEMSVQEIGKRTGMLSEDIVAALTEMGVCETVVPKKKQRLSDGTNGMSATTAIDEEAVVTMMVKRSAILAWADRHGVRLEDPVKEEGFLGEWASTDEGELVTDEVADKVIA